MPASAAYQVLPVTLPGPFSVRETPGPAPPGLACSTGCAPPCGRATTAAYRGGLRRVDQAVHLLL
jgi:hypothetical protein